MSGRKQVTVLVTIVVLLLAIGLMGIRSYAAESDNVNASDSNVTSIDTTQKGTTYVPGGGTVKVNASGDWTHSYSAYQLISGYVTKDDEGHDELSKARYGQGLDEEFYKQMLTLDIPSGVEPYAYQTYEPQRIAEYLSAIINSDKRAKYTVSLAKLVRSLQLEPTATFDTGTEQTLQEGYYLLDSEDGQPMMVLIDDENPLVAYEKSNIPTVRKEVGETDDSTGDVSFGKNADYSKGETIPYRLIGTLPSNYQSFDTYHYEFTDTMVKGIKPDLDSVHVYAVRNKNVAIGDDEDENTSNTSTEGDDNKNEATGVSNETNQLSNADANTNTPSTNESANENVTPSTSSIGFIDDGIEDGSWLSTIPDNGLELTSYEKSITEGTYEDKPAYVLNVTFDDIKKDVPESERGLTIVVMYDAEIDPEYATRGLAHSNDNEVYLTYTRSPAGDALGDTKPDDAHVFTYELVITKTSSEDDAAKLQGAKFTIMNEVNKYLTPDGQWVDTEGEAGTFESGGDGLISIPFLDSGTYTLTETEAPDGYDLLESPVVIQITSDVVTGAASAEVEDTLGTVGNVSDENANGTDSSASTNDSVPDIDAVTYTLSASTDSGDCEIVQIQQDDGIIDAKIKDIPVQALPQTGVIIRRTAIMVSIVAVMVSIIVYGRRRKA